MKIRTMYYIKDLQTGEIKEFPTLYRIEKFLNMRTQLKSVCVSRKRIINNRYILSDSLDFTKVRKKTGIQKNWIIYDNETISEYNCNSAKMCEILGLTYNTFRQGVNQGTLMSNRYRVYTKGSEIKHLQSKERKKRPPIRKNIFIFDTFLKTITERYASLQEVATVYNLNKYEVQNSINQNQRVRDRYYFNYENNFNMKQKKFKKTNAQLKKQKVDLSENGDFVYKEPNKPAKRIGKLGVDGIKNRLKKR